MKIKNKSDIKCCGQNMERKRERVQLGDKKYSEWFTKCMICGKESFDTVTQKRNANKKNNIN